MPKSKKKGLAALKKSQSASEDDEPSSPPRNRDKLARTAPASASAADRLSALRERTPRSARTGAASGRTPRTPASARSTTSALARSRGLGGTGAFSKGGAGAGHSIDPGLMPEVHLLGEIVGGSDFRIDGAYISCRWYLEVGEHWRRIEGVDQGQSQYDKPGLVEAQNLCVWNHPIDVHYSTRSLQGWPKMVLQIWRLDTHGATDLIGHGVCAIPSKAGVFNLKCSTWRPVGSNQEELSAFFIGGTPRLKSDAPVLTAADKDRLRLITVGAGSVEIRMNVLVKYFENAGVDS